VAICVTQDFYEYKNLRKNMLKKILFVLCTGLVVLIVVSLNSAQEKGQEALERTEVTQQEKVNLIPYTVLREWNPDKDPKAVGLEIAISPDDVTTENVVALVKDLSKNTETAFIGVYDSKEAWQAGQNEIYGTVYKNGYIGMLTKRGSVINQIRWFQEEGPVSDKFGSVTNI
jgi:hypothetical protein